MFCTNCGQEIDDDSVYCRHCGDKILKIKEEEKIKEDRDIFKEIIRDIRNINITMTCMTLCIALLTIGLIISIMNTINSYIIDKTDHIFGQIIFGPIFLISAILLWKSKKIGGSILIPFILFKMTTSAYYYLKIPHEYPVNNLIIDEIFYLMIILFLIIGWKNLK